MPTNFYMFFIAGIIPMIIGAIYYSEALFGKKWMAINGLSKEELESGNMALIMGLAYLLSVVLSFGLSGLVIHQTSVYQMMMGSGGVMTPEAQETFTALMADYGNNHRGWSHGALHGVIATVFIALPLIAINALFERRGGAYVGIHFGYWLLSLTAMGALLCATLNYAA